MRTFSIIISQRVKIVHVRGITPGIIMIALSKLLKVKILFDMRGLLAEEYVGGGMWSETSAQFRLVKKAERKLLTITDAVTVLTQKHLALNRSLDYIKHRDIPMDVVPCCVDMAKFDYRPRGAEDFKRELGIGGNFVLMYPGKIGTFYLVNEMIEFFKAMSEKVKNSIFLVITNDDASGLLRRARDAGIPANRLMVIKAVPFEEMPKHLALADAGIFFINPYKKIGSSPIKMGEFLASGVPVIINPGIGDTEEIVREGNVGVVVDKFTKDDYSRAVDKLLELIGGGKALKERCREVAARRLSLDEAITKYAGLYKAIGIENAGAEKI